MIHFELATEVARPVDEVFSLVTDPARLPDWQKGTISAEVEGGGPLRQGARIRELHKGPLGRELRSVVEVVAFEPGRRFNLRIVEGPLPIHGDHEFTAIDGGTRIDFTAHGELRGPMRIAGPLIGHAISRQFRGHFGRLKQVAEG